MIFNINLSSGRHLSSPFYDDDLQVYVTFRQIVSSGLCMVKRTEMNCVPMVSISRCVLKLKHNNGETEQLRLFRPFRINEELF